MMGGDGLILIGDLGERRFGTSGASARPSRSTGTLTIASIMLQDMTRAKNFSHDVEKKRMDLHLRGRCVVVRFILVLRILPQNKLPTRMT
jgi:hypothetical protein